MRHDDLYLADALKAIQELREFLAGITREAFLADRLKQSFVFHRLVIIGEACVSVSPTYRSTYPEVPWRQISGLRNRLVHAYFDLDLTLVWDTASTDLDKLAAQLKRILDAEFPDGSRFEA